jgi:hypothetical protein
MDLERIHAVLEDVLGGVRRPRQLAGLAHGDEAGADLVRHRPAEDEPACLGGRDDVDPPLARERRDLVDRLRERRRVQQQRGDVLEDDPGLWEVRDVADVVAEVDGGVRRG